MEGQKHIWELMGVFENKYCLVLLHNFEQVRKYLFISQFCVSGGGNIKHNVELNGQIVVTSAM
jgi:hypothetical protein